MRSHGSTQCAASAVVSATQAVRAVFLIDPGSKARAMLDYPLTPGRHFQEIKRMAIAMQTLDKHGVATPADWQSGKEAVVPAPGTGGAARTFGRKARMKRIVVWTGSWRSRSCERQ